MKILVIRHGVAEEKGGKPDAERALTKSGRKRMIRAAKGIAKLVPKVEVETVRPSPLNQDRVAALANNDEFGYHVPVLASKFRYEPLNLLTKWKGREPVMGGDRETQQCVTATPGFVDWIRPAAPESTPAFDKFRDWRSRNRVSPSPGTAPKRPLEQPF